MQTLTFYGASWCQDCQRAKHFLGEHKIDYKWIDVDHDKLAAAKVAELNGGRQMIPTLLFADGSTLVNPTNQQLADKLSLPAAPEKHYQDLAIIGAGPTGMAAAIYTTREDISTTLYEKKAVGGLAGITDMIDNYPGFPDGVSGIQLAEDMEKQARRFGAEFKTGSEIKRIERDGKYLKLSASDGEHFAKSVLVATGNDYRKLDVPGEIEFTSRGVHYCATCDGPFYRDKELVVVGGGNSAMQESIFLTKFAKHITLLVRGPELRGTELLINKVVSMPQIDIHYNTAVTSINGDKLVGSVSAETAGKPVELKTDGVFIFIGLIPNTGWLKGVVDLDHYGFIKTDKTFQSSLPGVYAAGDVRAGSTLQIASAVGEGVTAALMIREYLKEEG